MRAPHDAARIEAVDPPPGGARTSAAAGRRRPGAACRARFRRRRASDAAMADRGPPIVRVPSYLKAAARSVRERLAAGARPKRIPVPTATANVASSTRRSMTTSCGIATTEGNSVRSTGSDGVGDGNAQRGAREREQNALGEELPHDAAACRAKRRADRDLAPARGRAREQEARGVGARDQQDERNRGPDDEQERPRIAAHALLIAARASRRSRPGGSHRETRRRGRSTPRRPRHWRDRSSCRARIRAMT